MKFVYFVKRFFIFQLILLTFLSVASAEKIKVACVGDSITAGAGIRFAEDKYPAQLQNFLGENYEVKNFGISGTTLLSKGDFPYITTGAYRSVPSFNPNIVVIKLGTNDTKPQNIVHKDEFEENLETLVNTFKNLPSNPKIYLAYPAYVTRQSWGINEHGVNNIIIPKIKNVAKKLNLETIDIHSLLFGKAEYFADGVHPNGSGAKVMAQKIANAIDNKIPAPKNSRKTFAGAVSEWNGFKMHESQFSDGKTNHQLIVVEPKVAAKGKPWILRPAFFGHEPQADIALLNLGYHVVYLDVTHLYGTPLAVEICKKLQEYLVSVFELSEKVVLEGFSRGGYFALRYACTYPENVASLYLDAPVCDLHSWPQKNDKNAYAQALKLWDASETDTSKIDELQPAKILKNLAAKKVPMLLVCGDSDTVVPFEENGKMIADLYEKLGAPRPEIILKQGVNHHPHSFKDPTPIVNFITKNQPNYNKEEYLKYAKTVKVADFLPEGESYFEVRSGVGNFKKKCESGKATVAFLGGSITEMRGWKDMVKDELKKRYPKTEFTFIDAGIASTGSTPHAFRLENDILKVAKPDLLFFEASVNDHTNKFSKDEQIKGVEGVIAHALRANPNMDIVYMHFVYEETAREKLKDITPEVFTNHESVAKHYKIPSIDFITEITELMKADKLNWEEFGGTHPAPYGHLLYTRSIFRLFDKSPTNKMLKPHRLPKQKLDKFAYDFGKFVDIKSAKIKSGFEIVENWQPSIKKGTRKNFVNVPMLAATQAGAELEFKFKGTAVGLFCASGADAGIIEYSIDGGETKRLDTCTPWSPHLYIPWLFMLEKELPNKNHTLTLKMSADKNKNSQGNALYIRNIVVNSPQN